MGAGRKTQTILINGNAAMPTSVDAQNPNKRNLMKGHLGGVIFGCTSITIKECLSKNLFGLPGNHISYVRNIDPGLPLFLFNYSDRKLHGIFEAASSGEMNINQYGWTNGSQKTPYPAQVKVRIRLHCRPLLEEQFRPVIGDNYFSPNRFWFELDHSQTNKLMSLLAPLAIAAGAPTPQSGNKWTNKFQSLPPIDTKGEGGGFESPYLGLEQTGHPSRKLDFSYVPSHVHGAEEKYKDLTSLVSEVEHSNHSSRKSDSTDGAQFDGHMETHPSVEGFEQSEKELILKKLKQLVLEKENLDSNLTNHVDSSSVINDTHADLQEAQTGLERKNEGILLDSQNETILHQLINEVKELKEFKTEQTQKMSRLEHKLIEADEEIQHLKNRCTLLESMSKNSGRPVHDLVIQSFSKPHLDPRAHERLIQSCDEPHLIPIAPERGTISMDELCSDPVARETAITSLDEAHFDLAQSVFLIGGYDGELWLSSMDSYFPPSDMVKSYRPMSYARSYASVSQMDGEIFVMGGGDGCVWYDTVESYNPQNDQWTSCPSLNGKRGSLATANLKDKVYAFGGGNGVDCFSDAQMLDFDVGKWIHTRSMLQKRFALAAVEHNSAFYAVGGYDGIDYLNSAERFDPREHSWTKIASMKSKRGCHTMVILNERIYAVGGFDGDGMVSSVEIFDPRLGTWICGDPLNQSRGYSAAAVVNESIYVIGGVRDGEDILDTVECWKDGGQGWEETKTKAIGKRCFLSAITLQ